MPRITKPRKIKSSVSDPRGIEDTLEEMYQEPDGSLPDMKHIDHRGSRAGLVVVFFVLFFLASAAAAAWLGFFLFSPSQKFSESQVVTEITPPSNIIDGVEQDYKIVVRNTGSLALANTRVILKLPDGFLVTDASPKATTDRADSWALGAIDGGASKTISLKAAYGMPKNTKDTLRAFIDYKPSNFNSEFEKIVDTQLTVAQEAVEISINQKSVTNGGQEFEIKYKNTTDASIMNVAIGVDAGVAFKANKTTPSAKTIAGVVKLLIPELLPKKENIFIVAGAYPVSSTPPTSIAVAVSRMFNGKSVDIARAVLGGDSAAANTTSPLPINNADPRLDPGPIAGSKSLYITANGLESISGAKPDDVIKFALTYKNVTGKLVKNVSLVLVGEAPSIKNKSVFDYTHLTTIGDPDVIGKQLTPDKREARITWTPEKTDVLKQVAPNQTVVIEFSVSVKKLDGVLKENSAMFTPSLSADDDVLLVGNPVNIGVVE